MANANGIPNGTPNGNNGLPQPSGLHPAVRKMMIDDYAIMERRVGELTSQLSNVSADREALFRENSALRSELGEVKNDFKKMQAYAVSLTAKLDMAMDAVGLLANHADDVNKVIAKIRTEAETAAAVHLRQQEPEEEEHPGLSSTTSRHIEEALSRLPPNNI